MRTVLFVDEDQGLRDGLRRTLRARREVWRSLFAGSGEEALDFMAREPVDVLFTELVLPGMSGNKLLDKTAREHPGVIRNVLSGQINPDQALQAVGPAHQYLAKPCPPDRLLATLDRADRLLAMLGDNHLGELIAGMRSIPAMPVALAQIEAELAREEPSVARLGETISHDPALSAGVLKLVNSSYFGLYTKVTNPAQAVALLGLDLIRGAVLGVHLFNAVAPDAAGVEFARLMEHSYNTGCLAKVIAETEQPGDQNFAGECFLGGLLHDVGLLLLLDRSPGYAEFITKTNEVPDSLWNREYEALGTSHAEVGAYLLGLWGVPDAVFEAVCYHHVPSRGPTQSFSVLTVVHLANALEYFLFEKENLAFRPLVNKTYLEAVGKLHRLKAWRDACVEWVDQHGWGDGDE